jgi:hypothetical protein
VPAFALAGAVLLETFKLPKPGARIMRPNSPIMNGLPSSRCCQTSRVAAGGILPIYHLLQPIRPLAASWCPGRRIVNALAAAHDAAVQIDISNVRVHQHGACITRNQRQSMERSRGGYFACRKTAISFKSGSMLLPTVAMTPIGSDSLSRSRARGPTLDADQFRLSQKNFK